MEPVAVSITGLYLEVEVEGLGNFSIFSSVKKNFNYYQDDKNDECIERGNAQREVSGTLQAEFF